MDIIKQAIAAPPRRRQAASSPASADTASTTASMESSTSSTASATEAGAGETAITTALPDGSVQTIISVVNPPPFTATSTTAYTAPGINATHPITNTPSFTTTTTTSFTSTTSTTSSYVDPAASALAAAKAFGIPKNQLTACQINGTEANNGPFCSPIHLQNLYVGFTYAITWNPSLFAKNATNVAELRYNNASSDHPPAWTSPATGNYRGYVDVEMNKTWLLGAPGNDTTSGQNMTLVLISTPAGEPNITKPGPTLSLTVDPKTLPPVVIPKIASKYGLEIGLPIGVVALILILLGLWCGVRKSSRNHRSIKLAGKDYMARRARKRRLGGDVPLEEYDNGIFNKQDQYTDQPVTGGAGENVFRQEVARQREEDDASLKRTYTSF